jgi:hypothetical protein
MRFRTETAVLNASAHFCFAMPLSFNMNRIISHRVWLKRSVRSLCSGLYGTVYSADTLNLSQKLSFLLSCILHSYHLKYLNFVGHLERRFDCRVQVLRTGGVEEYANIDSFCERNGIARQRTESANPASNGKAERMHRKVLNMARCMIFYCRLPMHFWGNAMKYLAYVLNRSPCKSNPLTHVVTFGSPCMIYRSPDKSSLASLSERYHPWRLQRSQRFSRIVNG